MKVTIHDVAKHAGVSVATVSRYLNNSPLIAPASVEKVRKSIEKLNYSPNMMARGLARRSTDTVALVVDYTDTEIYGNEFFLKIQFGLEQELARNGFFLMLVNVEGKQDAPSVLSRIIQEERADGIVLLNEMALKEATGLLACKNTPFVVVGREEVDDVSWVDIDNVHGGYIAARQLIESGSQRIGFICNSFKKRFVADRFAGYKKAMQEAGLQIREDMVVNSQNNLNDLLEYLNTNGQNLCDSYVVSDGSLGYFFVKALTQVGISVPDDVQIVSFDNQLLSQISEPGLTVVDIDVTDLGVNAARILLEKLKAPESAVCVQKLIKPTMIKRESVR